MLSALSMSRSISAFSGTLLCPPVKRLLIRKPVSGRTGSCPVALSLASSCLETTAESIFRSSAILSSFSSPRKSISRLTKSTRSSVDRFSSESRLQTILRTCSASIDGDSASSISSSLQTRPSVEACRMSLCSASVIRFSYAPSCSFISRCSILFEGGFFWNPPFV